MSGAGLYIHIPFCIRKCHYCDFYSIPSLIKKDAFIHSLLQEMRFYQSYPPFGGFNFSTLYLGGGTPSLLPSDDMQQMITEAADCFKIEKNAEMTCEINPGSLHTEDLKKYYETGINRISLGFQSLQDDELHILSRIHSAQQALSIYHEARAIGFQNIGIDLIYGIPGQTLHSWQQNLQYCIELKPEHVSIYSLSYEQGTPLTEALQKREIEKCGEIVEREMFLLGQELLCSAGYEHYEISNFALPHYRSQHNQKYWGKNPYLGLGPSAHSFDGVKRWWNVADVDAYCCKIESKQAAVSGQEQISSDKALIELIMLGLRKKEGMDLNIWQRQTGENFLNRYQKIIDELGGLGTGAEPFGCSAKGQLLTLHNDALCLTREGLLLYDKICEKLAANIFSDS